MATTIRLTRMGKKKRPFYRLVVLDSRTRRDGAYLANLGRYNPFVEPPEVALHDSEILDWLSKGATVSETARSLLKREGVLLAFSLHKQGLPEAEIAQRVETWRQGAAQRVERDESDRMSLQRQIAEAERERRQAVVDAKKAAADAAAAEAAAAEPAEGEES